MSFSIRVVLPESDLPTMETMGIIGRLPDDPHACQDREHHRGGDHRSDLAAGVGAHRMHEEVALLVPLLPFTLDDARRHREGGDPGRADQGVDLAAGHYPHDL